MSLKVGDSFPEGVTFTYVPPAPDAGLTSCGVGIKYDASKEFKNKKAVLVTVPGAFTPTCQEQHLTSYLDADNYKQLRAKGVDTVIFIAGNDHWVMSAWGKANGVKDESILFMADDGLAFSKSIGWANGERAARGAIIVDHGKVVYADKDVPKSIAASSAEAVLAKL